MSGKQATTVSISPALTACCNSFKVNMPGMTIPPFIKIAPARGLDPRGRLRQPLPASNLADGLLSSQELGLALLDHFADRWTLGPMARKPCVQRNRRRR